MERERRREGKSERNEKKREKEKLDFRILLSFQEVVGRVSYVISVVEVIRYLREEVTDLVTGLMRVGVDLISP